MCSQSSSSSRSATSTPSSSSSGSLTLVQPSTPHMGSVNLPPSPPYGNVPNTYVPHAPYLGPVSLPYTAPATPWQAPFGLMTPPHTPEARRTSNNIHPILACNPRPGMLFEINRHPQEARLAPCHTSAVFGEMGFQNPINGFLVNVIGTDWHFPISQRRPLMVSDILEQVYAWASVVCSRNEMADLPAHVLNAANEYFRTRGVSGSAMRRFHVLGPRLRFAGFSRAADGSSWNLHLSSVE